MRRPACAARRLLAFLLTEWLVAKLLFETSPNDPVTFVAVAGALTLASRCLRAGEAATRVDPDRRAE